jgi:hypothetical protein
MVVFTEFMTQEVLVQVVLNVTLGKVLELGLVGLAGFFWRRWVAVAMAGVRALAGRIGAGGRMLRGQVRGARGRTRKRPRAVRRFHGGWRGDVSPSLEIAAA